MSRDLSVSIAFALAVHLLAIGATLVSWEIDTDLAGPDVPPHVEAVVMEREAAPEPGPRRSRPEPEPSPESVSKPEPEPEKQPEPEPKPERTTSEPDPSPRQPELEQPGLEEMLAREELEMEEARQQDQASESSSAPASAGEENAEDSELARQVGAIRAAVARHWNRPPSARKGMETTLRIRLLPGGEVVEATVVESSGNLPLDRSTVAAVENASPLPVPSGRDFNRFRKFTMSFKPEDLSL